MYSFGILSAILFALIATTNASTCRPVLCMLACGFGFDVDEQGCPICSCRKTPNVCVEPIFGYNCGTIDHRDCPSSHQCQLSFTGLTGQCCLKLAAASTTAGPTSTTLKTATSASTARATTSTPRSATSAPRSTTSAPRSTTGRALKRLLAFPIGAEARIQRSDAPVSTTQSSVTDVQGSGAPVSTTGSSVTGPQGSGAPVSTTGSSAVGTTPPFDFQLPEWIGVGKK